MLRSSSMLYSLCMKAVCTTFGPEELATAAAPRLRLALVWVVSIPPLDILDPCSTSGLLLFGGPIPAEEGEVFVGSGDVGEAVDCGRIDTWRDFVESRVGPKGFRAAD